MIPDDAPPSTLIVHSKAEVNQITSTEDDLKVRTLNINWDAPQDEAALYNAVGAWLADMRKEHGHAFRLKAVIGDLYQVAVSYQVVAPRERLSVVANDVVAA